ncbi:MAG: hypothetical protein ABN482_09525 [Corticimicrobacter sp.]|uniref:hypothetical protein n=1 Tax=Corticimicrobacter sp. TaxID=2678536 RepID=UPI0032DB6884
MNSLFMFPWKHEEIEFRVLFKGPGHIPASYFEDAIKSAAQTILYPDGIIVIALADDGADLSSSMQDENFKASLRRLAGKIGVYTCLINPEQKTAKTKKISKNTKSDFITSALRKQKVISLILSAGLTKAFGSDGLVLPAPPGYHFQKPSGDGSSHFIKAEEALSRSEIVDFIALTIAFKMGQKRNLKTIYIDTMGISSLAYALREILRSSSSLLVPRIVSFRSHDGLEKVPAPIPGTAYCIISASSSLSLEKLWRTKTNCADDEVITLLTFNDTPGCENALFQLERPKDWAERMKLELRGTKGMRTLGERFQQEQMPPKKVALTKDYHPSEEAKEISSSFWDKDFLNIDVSTENGKHRTFHANGELLVQHDQFLQWLRKQIRSSVPASIQGIIYQDDPSSKILADKCRTLLEEYSITLAWGVRSSTDCESHLTELDQERGLLVVAAVVGQGQMLLGISRDLRPHHMGSKIYIVGLQICETAREQHFLKTNLANTKDQTNRFLTWNRLSTGPGLRLSLQQELDLNSDPELQPLLSHRHNRQMNVGLGELSFLPTIDNNSPLSLRRDFLFWPEGYTPCGKHAPLVLATIGAILERARTPLSLLNQARSAPPLLEIHRLSSDIFQQVLLDPHNFNRFNDGIIQAAILRQALPSELDYSYTDEESGFMREFLIKIFLSRYKPQGEASLEFALAIAMRRLKIKEADLLVVQERVIPDLKNEVSDIYIRRLLQYATDDSEGSTDKF